MTKNKILAAFFLTLFSSCGVFKKTAKQELTDGYYTQKINNEKQKVYVDIVDENIHVYSTTFTGNKILVDTTHGFQYYSISSTGQKTKQLSLVKRSFDIDFLTIPLKFRFSQKPIPPQLNANINGAFFLGYRTDRYTLNYQMTPLLNPERKITHFGYSVGLFTGLGNTFISPTTTNNILPQEYDAVVWSKGIAAIAGVNNFTVGLAVGFDNLLDRNRGVWIYESKPWIGLAFGLNLN